MGVKHLDITYSIQRDEDLWKDLKSGSTQALAVIYDKYIDSMFAYGRHFTGNEAILEDCIQDVFMEIWMKRDRLGNTDAINFYLVKCLKLKLFKAIKKDQREFSPVKISDYFQIAEEASDSKDVELHKRLRGALETLNPRQKEILLLKYYNQFSSDQIGDMLEMTRKQVYNDTAIAIRKIREILLYLVLVPLFML